MKQVLLHSNNFYRADTFPIKVLFQKRYFFTWRYNTYYRIIISLVLYLYVFQNSYFLEKAFSRKEIFCIGEHFFRVVRPNTTIAGTFSENIFFSKEVLFHS